VVINNPTAKQNRRAEGGAVVRSLDGRRPVELRRQEEGGTVDCGLPEAAALLERNRYARLILRSAVRDMIALVWLVMLTCGLTFLASALKDEVLCIVDGCEVEPLLPRLVGRVGLFVACLAGAALWDYLSRNVIPRSGTADNV
jgi:hypothetical protein